MTMLRTFFPFTLFLILIAASGCDQNQSPSIATLSVTSLPEEGGTTVPDHAEMEVDSTIQVTAEPSDGWQFLHWEGDLESEENPGYVTMRDDMDLIAVFEPIESIPDSSDEEPPSAEIIYDPDSLPTLVPGQSEQVDMREFFFSSDPDDSDIPLEEVEVLQSSANLVVTEEEPFLFQIQTDQGAGTTETVEVRVETAVNSLTQTITFEVAEDSDTIDSEHLVIMPLGDSITNDGRSRIRLWHLLTDDGHTIDYVGDQQQRTRIPDPDHEGVGGLTIQEVHEKVRSLMRRHDPEFTFLMIGTNNIAWYINEPAEDIAKRWHDLVVDLLDSNSDHAWLIAATIPPMTSEESEHDHLEETDRAVVTRQYNEEVRRYIAEFQEAGENIILADIEAALTIDDHLYEDGVHLNGDGYELMGTLYYEALIEILENR